MPAIDEITRLEQERDEARRWAIYFKAESERLKNKDKNKDDELQLRALRIWQGNALGAINSLESSLESYEQYSRRQDKEVAQAKETNEIFKKQRDEARKELIALQKKMEARHEKP